MHTYSTDGVGAVGADHALDKVHTEIIDFDSNTEKDLGPEAMTSTDPGPDNMTTKEEIVKDIIDID